MKYKKLLLSLTLLNCAGLVIALLFSNTKLNSFTGADANSDSYRIEFDKDKNRFTSNSDILSNGNSYSETNLLNKVGFTYSKMKGANTTWQVLGENGYFYNIDPIHGMKSISVSFASDNLTYKVSYSRDNSFTHSKSFTSSSISSLTFDFDMYLPNYFKFENTSEDEIDITSLTIDYSCVDNTSIMLSLSVDEETKGSVSGSGLKKPGEEVSITATSNDGYVFDGWYEGDNRISNDNPYTFTMPEKSVSYKASFITKEEDQNRKLGITPVFSDDKSSLTYGLYPQSHVNNTDTIDALNKMTTTESNGWYLYDGEYYAKKNAYPYDTNYAFSDGTQIDKKTEYWFKCEPIEWKVLETINGYSLVSMVLLDAYNFDSSSNSFRNSSINSWLNNDFLNSAFSLNNSLIQITYVDNTASTTDASRNPYADSYYIQEKIYLLSYKDYLNTDYGFPNRISLSYQRMCKPTDYALVNGCYQNEGNGCYWTRSPYSMDSRMAWYVTSDGSLESNNDVDLVRGVRPALTIKI